MESLIGIIIFLCSDALFWAILDNWHRICKKDCAKCRVWFCKYWHDGHPN